MQAVGTPNPFPAANGFQIGASGGVPPYSYSPLPSPPNPPGVSVDSSGEVTIDPVPLPSTEVQVDVYDSSVPPQNVTVSNRAL
jgi:hypothetical protein